MIPGLPGIPVHKFHPSADVNATVGWLLNLVDDNADRSTIIAIPHAKTEAELDALEESFIRVYDLAKKARPDLGVKLLHGVDTGRGPARSHVIAVVHEHAWVGGMCARGCRDTRPVDDDAAAGEAA